jgi:AcrR family transcriptional regulator
MVKTNIKNHALVLKRQNQICRGAMQVFRKKGFHATSMREIAKHSGISLGNLYDYIEKKEDILFLLHRDILDKIYHHFKEISIKYEDPVQELIYAMKEIFRLISQLREEVLFIYTTTRSLEKKWLHERLEKESEFVYEIELMIKRGVSRGVFECKNPAIFANIIAYHFGIVPLRGWNILTENSEETLYEDLIQLILAGLGVRKNNIF